MKKEIITGNIGVIIYFAIIGSLLFLMANPMILANIIFPGLNDNPFDEMKKTEREVVIEGLLTDVLEFNDPYDGRQREVYIYIDFDTYRWVTWEYDDLKTYEGEQVIIHCYTNDYDPVYYMSPVSYNSDMGYIEKIEED